MKKYFAILAAFAALGSLHGNEILKNDNFNSGLRGWNSPGYWAGKSTSVTEDGKKYFQLESGTRGKEVFGRALGYSKQIEYFAGDMVKIQLKAKGTGKLVFGLLTYSWKGGAPAYLSSPDMELTGEFKSYEYTFELKSRYKMILPYIQVTGEGKALIESYKMEKVTGSGTVITPVSTMQIVTDIKAASPVKFSTNLPGQEVTAAQKWGNALAEQKVKTDDKGAVSVTPDAAGKDVVEVAVSAKSAAATGYISVEKPEDFAKTDAVAKNIKFPKNMNILIIGDSLSDFYRGQNYVDRVNFWLNKYNPGKVYIRNAGVGGDYIQRVEERLAGTNPGSRKAYRQDMYNNLFDREYDLVFIFLGQNDTRTTRGQKFAVPLMNTQKQEKCYRSVLNFIGKRSKGKIVLISPSPSNLNLFVERDKKLAPGADMVMYGQTKLVDDFDAVSRKLCKELGLDYIDITKPMRSVQDIKSLYVADGVHLSPAGGRLIADEVLKYFAEKYK